LNGINVKLYNLRYQPPTCDLPNYDNMRPAAEFEDNLPNTNPHPTMSTVHKVVQSDDNWGLRYDGNLFVPYAGVWEFGLASDDASKLYLNDKLIVDNDGCHGQWPAVWESVPLEQGLHKLRLDFMENSHGQALTLLWKRNVEGSDEPKIEMIP